MSDPSTLLLIACTSCGNDNYQDQYQDSSVHTAVEALNAKTHSDVDSHQSGVSAPETEPIAFASEVNPPDKSLQTSLALDYPKSRPNPPELMASVSVAENVQENYIANQHTLLRLGDEGEAVKEMQRQLRTQGYYQGIVDGIYGSQTFSAVAQFQQSRGLEADGVFGLKTWQELKNSLNTSPFTTPKPAPSRESTVKEDDSALTQETLDSQLKKNFILDLENSAYWWLLGWSGIYVGGWLFIVRGFRDDVSGFKYVTVSASEEEPDIHRILSAQGNKPLSFARNRTKPTLRKPKGLGDHSPTNSPSQKNQQATPKPEPTLMVHDAPELPPSLFSRAQGNKTFGRTFGAPQPVKQPELEKAQAVTPLRPKDTQDCTLVAVIASQQKAEQEGYTYSLVDDAEGRFVLKGTELFIPNQSLTRFEVENSYKIKIRRTDAKGSFVDKLFRVDVPKEVLSA